MRFLAASLVLALGACGGGGGKTFDAPPPTIDAPPVPAPTIDGFSPGMGAPATPVMITGSNLGGVNAVVRFHGTQVTDPVMGDDSTLMVNVPDGATTGKITVTTSRGTGLSAMDFVVPGTSGADAAPPVSDAAP
jgi:hypothetical protein